MQPCVCFFSLTEEEHNVFLQHDRLYCNSFSRALFLIGISPCFYQMWSVARRRSPAVNRWDVDGALHGAGGDAAISEHDGAGETRNPPLPSNEAGWEAARHRYVCVCVCVCVCVLKFTNRTRNRIAFFIPRIHLPFSKHWRLHYPQCNLALEAIYMQLFFTCTVVQKPFLMCKIKIQDWRNFIVNHIATVRNPPRLTKNHPTVQSTCAKLHSESSFPV